MLAAHGATQAPIQVRMRFLQVTDDFEIDPLHLRQVDLLDMDESQQLADWLGHLASALVARASALRDADLGPELFLVQSQAAPDFTRIQHSVKEFHKSSVEIYKAMVMQFGPKRPPLAIPLA